MPRASLQLKVAKGDLIDGKYIVIQKLGEGGCGSVYRCRNAKLPEKEVALKILENAADLPRFRREQKVLNSVRNDYVVRLLDHGHHDRHPYLALEFMQGGSLRDLMNERDKLSVEEAAWIILQSVWGLKASKTVHRDLKPENLLLSRGQGKARINLVIKDARRGAQVKVADFGLAKQRDPGVTALTNTGQIMGTPLYMSPEQCRNTKNVTIQSDIYALGIILYELVVGKPPFDADNAYDIMAKHCNDEPRIPKNLDPRLKAMLARCLAKNASERYRGLTPLERDLRQIVGMNGEPEAAGGGHLTTWVLSAIALLALGATGWLLRRDILTWIDAVWNGTVSK